MILRPYQSDLVEGVWAKHKAGHRNILMVLPTGGGKTACFATLTAGWTGQGEQTCILVHRRELLNQASQALARVGVPHGRIEPGRMQTRDPVQVASVDTLLARAEDLRPVLQRFTRVITDEAHHAVAGKWATVRAMMPGAQGLGVTATPFRADGAGLGEQFDDFVQGPTVRDLIGMGFLSAFRTYQPPAHVDLSKVKTRMGDYVVRDLVAAVDRDEVTLPAIEHYRRLADRKPAIAFCASVEHAHSVAKQFAAAGYRAASIDGEMKVADRDRAIRDLGAGHIDVLTSCDIVSEGTDIPIVAAAILLRPTMSTGLYMQQVGRVLRPAPGKEHAIIIDVVGNAMKHGMVDAVRPWSLTRGVKGMERAVPATRRCRYCYLRVEIGPETCPGCDRSYGLAHRPPRLADTPPPLAAPTPSSLDGLAAFSDEQIMRMPMQAAAKIARTREELERIARVRGYKPGWVQHILAGRGDQRAVYAQRRRWGR